jgi:signal transduction histidine kinase
MTDSLQTKPHELADALGEYLATTSVLGVAQLDAQGTVISANETLERLAGRPLAGRSIRELIRVEQHPALDRMLDSAERRWHRHTLGLFPDHRGIPLDFSVSCRPLGGRRLLIAEPLAATVNAVNEQLLALNDELATAQRRIRSQNAELAQHNEDLRELDRLKDTLLANVSHDLRTPLTAVLGYAELLRLRGGMTDKQTQAVDVIERNARRLLRLVSDLLLLAQARAGTFTLEREAVDLSQLAAEAVELTRPLADHAELTLALQAQPPGPVIDADRLRLGQLLDNLIANAIKFTPTGGTVTVRVQARPGAATLEVQDTGPGFPEAERESLFEAFTRGSTTDAPGTGLGLTIVRAVVDAHGATIDVDTEPGHGARFTVTFPAAHR